VLSRRRNQLAIGASVVAHLVLLAIVAQHAAWLGPAPDDTAPAPLAIQVWLVPAPRTASQARADRPGAGARWRRPDEPVPEPASTPAVATAPAAVVGQPAPQMLPDSVRATLRRRLGCQERSGLRLAADERGDCNERLGHGAAVAPYLHAPIAPEIRTYWDAVAKSKAPDGPPTPQSARGRAGMFDPVGVGMKGHGPVVGCHISFGHGIFRVDHPPHGLKLGPLPCFIRPPAGSLSPDVDVQNPDEVARGRKAGE
jgi:hypothetical protein